MKVSAKVDYATRALMELALHWPNSSPLQVASISREQLIPENFLIQILLNLKQLGLVKSVRGKNGGYLLARQPAQIKLVEIIKAFDKQWLSYEGDSRSVIDDIWRELNDSTLRALEDITFENIINRKKKHDNVVMFEI